MEEMRKKILSFINRASLPAEDISFLEKVITHIPDELIADVLRFIEIEPNSINFINDNLKKKKNFIETGDKKILEQVLAEQKQFLMLPFLKSKYRNLISK
jgi:hypothetical protein